MSSPKDKRRRKASQTQHHCDSLVSEDIANCDSAQLWQHRKKAELPPHLDPGVDVRSCGCPKKSDAATSGPVPCMTEFHTEKEEYVCLGCNKEVKRKFGCRTCQKQMQQLNAESTGEKGVAGCILGRCFSRLDARPLYIACTNEPGGKRSNQLVVACTSDSKFFTVEQCKHFELPIAVPPEQAVGPVGDSDWRKMRFRDWDMRHYHPAANATRPGGARRRNNDQNSTEPAYNPPHFLYPRLRGRRVEDCGALAYLAQQRTYGNWQWMTSSQLFHTCGQPAINSMEMFDRLAVGLFVLIHLACGWCVCSYGIALGWCVCSHGIALQL